MSMASRWCGWIEATTSASAPCCTARHAPQRSSPSGAVEVLRDGQLLARLGPGDAFGEIALLLDVPRTASVLAVAPTELLALEASAFRDLLAGYLGRAGELERLSYLRLRTHKRLDEIV